MAHNTVYVCGICHDFYSQRIAKSSPRNGKFEVGARGTDDSTAAKSMRAMFNGPSLVGEEYTRLVEDALQKYANATAKSNVLPPDSGQQVRAVSAPTLFGEASHAQSHGR